MLSIPAAIRKNGLFQRRRDLLALGYSDFQIRKELHAGRIIRVRQGHYSLPDAVPDALKAVRIGGRLTGLSALKTYGHWAPKTDKLHVVVPSDARALRSATDKQVRFSTLKKEKAKQFAISWTDDATLSRSPSPWRVSVVDALVHVLRTADRETAIVCLDSALNVQQRTDEGKSHLEGISPAQLDEVFARAPARVQPWRADVDGRAQSGGETKFRLACEEAGIHFVPQSPVPGVEHHDGRIGPHTYVELNSVEHHLNVEQFEEDHRRQAQSTLWGNRVLNFTNKQVKDDWDFCLDVMSQALAEDAALTKSTEVCRGGPPMRGRSRRGAENPRRFENDRPNWRNSKRHRKKQRAKARAGMPVERTVAEQ
ncbi:type IV toxin-antitoxin system AbiEi family antitoxin domain-containing protein [Rathayibacter soli]|uniref:type IV toxin-antitoxin system AbiEi family antitoxin domain-containing protein n=1 Tax=Rathayibacter soli TaxID=3144168 RepID=UPI0027E4BA35|nr:type IV toxin-antitoxin system AbiEi family antitoxin domain-containing protein [Glaciibacter superstes]